MADGEELDLDTLNDAELVEQMHDDLYDGLREEIEAGTRILLARGWSAEKVLNEALVEGMRIVGVDFRDGILFVPEVLLAANAMKGGMEILRPILAKSDVEPIGKIVIGTVKGDVHDIGKNLVGMMLEGAGFEVIDLGINNPVEKYLAALEQHRPDILGMSALLTTTMPYMKVVIDTLKEKGLRDDYIVLVGGAPLVVDTGTLVVQGTVIHLSGVEGEAGDAARELVRYLRGRPVACEPVDAGGGQYRCKLGDYDLGEAVLLNGAGRAAGNASERLRGAEERARAFGRGIWRH